MAASTAPAANRPQRRRALVRRPEVQTDGERVLLGPLQHDLRDEELAERRR